MTRSGARSNNATRFTLFNFHESKISGDWSAVAGR
jgi:hypothetical protein